MSSQEWVTALGPFHTADAAPVTASGALTEMSPLPQLLIPAPYLGQWAGKRLEYYAWGYYTTTGTQGTITFDLRLGPTGAIGSMTSVCATSALTWVASQTNRIWRMEGHISIRSVGAAGTGVGIMEFSNVTAGTTDMAATAAGSTFAVDTTVARYLALGCTLSVASQSITCRQFGLRSVN